MKGFFALLLLIFLIPSPQIAHAEEQYARVICRDCYFYTQPDESTALFLLPYTYCVQVLQQGEWCKIQYAEDNGIYEALVGYCKADQLLPLDTRPAVTYLHHTVKLTFSTGTANPNLPVLEDLTVTGAYYGTFYIGPNAYSYVGYASSFGYIEGAYENYPLQIVETPPPEQPTPSKENHWTIALLLVGLALFTLLILFASGKRQQKQ